MYESTNQTSNEFLQGLKDCVPTLIGYLSIGIAFGVVGIASHLSILEIVLLSVLVYAGSAQFIFCALYMAGAPISAVIVTIFIVNLRHLLMSFSIAPYFKQYGLLKNIGIGTLLTDETFSVASVTASQQGKLGDRWMNGLNVTAYASWIAACTLGGIVGKFIANPEKWGLDYALIAMFIALLVLSLQSLAKSKVRHYIKLIGTMIVCMYVLLYFMPSYVAVLVATIVVATIGVLTEK